MGSGKTTLGKRLANKLNKTFFDLDAEIEKDEGKSIDEIFSTHGEIYFRKLESSVLNKVINGHDNFVLSLGGGTPCFNENMELINQSGASIYLKYNAGMLTSRLINAKTKRPLIKDLNELGLKAFVINKLMERENYYNLSKLVAEGDNLKIDELINLIQ
ncbi:MAG: shikimate kinase [Flavobacteriales bacterium]|nr:shikimate kinase [Flavobacteriales bacterium]